MVSLEIDHNNYFLLLQQIASALNITHQPSQDFLEIPAVMGTGYFKVLRLFDELQVLIADAALVREVSYRRRASDQIFYVLHFDDVFISAPLQVKVDDEVLQKVNTRHSFARLTSSLFYHEERFPAGQQLKGVKVLFNENWLKKYLGLSSASEVLRKYLSLKTESFDVEPLDEEYMRLLNDLWQTPKNDPVQNILLQNRVTLLVERFFTRLHEKSNLINGVFTLSDDEIQRLIKVEQHLTGNFETVPPTIEDFSKMVSMSSTRLKKSFKEMFGDSIYSYYQKQRMQKANELLLSRKYSIKEVAEAVGYINTSNFIAAFKKQYLKLPSQVLAS